MKINKREFKAWIAALDSGEYRQGHCALQTSVGYCCLGVGCKATIPDILLALDSYGCLEGGIPDCQPAAPEWLKNIESDFKNKTGRSLLGLNDSFGYSFPEIATLLELVYIHKILD